MASKFEIFKDKKGEYRFRLKAPNGEIILASEGYTVKSNCKKGIASVKKNARSKKQFVMSASRNNKFYFLLRAKNNKVIGNSEIYNTKRAMEKGITAVSKHAGKAKIFEVQT